MAQKHNLSNWDNACYVWAGFVKQIEPFADEAAELYASQFKTPPVQEDQDKIWNEVGGTIDWHYQEMNVEALKSKYTIIPK